MSNHDEYTLGQFKNDMVKNHKHNRGDMNITGWFGNPVTANGRGANGAFSEDHWDSTHKFQNGGQWELYAGSLYLDASNGWSGLTSNPVDDNNVGIGYSVNRGKREGVKYIIKVL